MIDAEGRALGVTTENWLEPPYNRWAFRHVPDLVRTAPISRGSGPVRELPRAERDLDGFSFDHGGRTYTLAGMLAETCDGRLRRDPRRRGRDRAVLRRHARRPHAPPDVVLEVARVDPLTGCSPVAACSCRLTSSPTICASSRALPGRGCRIQDILDMRVGIAWDFDVDEYTIVDVSDYRTHDRARRRSRPTPRPGSVPSSVAPTATARARSATARSRRTCSAGSCRGLAGRRSRSSSPARSGRGSAPSTTPRSCSTTPASRSSRAASAPRSAISRGSGSCVWRTAGWTASSWFPPTGSRASASAMPASSRRSAHRKWPTRRGPTPSTTTSGGCSTGRAASTRVSA